MRLRLLLAAVLLASPLAAQQTEILTRTLTTTLTRTPPSDYYVVPVINGAPVMRGSPQCPPYTSQTFVPTADRARWIRGMTRRFIQQDLASGALTSPLSRQTTDAILAIDLGQTFYDRQIYGTYQVPPDYTPNCGTFLCTCAAGVATIPPSIATDDPSRVESLVAWETCNATLGLLQRGDLADGSYVSSVTRRVEQWLGGWQAQ